MGEYNIILDIASGSIHNVDDVAFDVISMYEQSSLDEIIKLVKMKYPKLTDDEINELFSEIEQLKSSGKLFADDAFAPSAAINQKVTIKALCMNVAHVCNMRCAYCFAGRGEYGGGDELMSLDVGKRAIDFLVENSDGRRNLDVDFFGGEPLLNWEVVKAIVAYAREIEKVKGKNFRFTFTTNGLMLDDEVMSFLNQEIHNVVLSLDGRPEVNDFYRVKADGSGSYAEIVDKYKKIVEVRKGKGYYIRGTITRKNLDFVNDILHLADLGFKEISLEPVVAKPGEEYGLTMDDLPDLSRQYEILATEMLRREKQKRGFSFYHFNLDLTGGPCIHKRIAGCGVGTEYLAVTPSGSLYPCHQFVGEEKFVIGNIWQGITNNELRSEFSGWDIYSRAKCKDCWAKMYCAGGCAANAYNDVGSIGAVYELGCEIFKKRLECAIMLKISQTLYLRV